MKNILLEYKNILKTGKYSDEISEYKRQLVQSIFSPADWGNQNCPGEVLTELSEHTNAKEIISIFNTMI
ncbi:hypothetical protein [Fluviispira vulneris]|uniref:hypothetical protein n=1 Tax=Fluviispira vulneris TaxID=2763012 RepID=UPI0016441D9B|nr:hypothetical protein [Fluviispira vulneris]